MSRYIINGGNRLSGEVVLSGAKNAVLPILCACLLCAEGTVTLSNCPDISDVTYTLSVLRRLGCKVSASHGQIAVNAESAEFKPLDCDEMGMLRSTALFLGACIGRFAVAEQCLPGGCELGARPIDMHLLAFSQMGSTVSQTENNVKCTGCTHSADITLRFPSVGATQNIILASALGKSEVVIRGAAREPEIVDMCNFINAMGGKIKGAGTDIIIVQGVEKLRGVNYNVMCDRIEAATFMAAALVTGGNITVRGAEFAQVRSFADVLVSCGGTAVFCGDSVTVSRAGPFLVALPYIETAPFPGFATDTQSIALALLSVCRGVSCVRERIFSDRLRLAYELNKMGADITVLGDRAYVNGVGSLFGAEVNSGDLRSGAALTVAALGAHGKSIVRGVHHIHRGYENFDKKLRALGADITEEY